jgi:hypothetical protein
MCLALALALALADVTCSVVQHSAVQAQGSDKFESEYSEYSDKQCRTGHANEGCSDAVMQ